MHHLNPSKTALSFAAFWGGVHLVWALLVALKAAQPLVEFVLWAHMLALAYVVKPFELDAAIVLIVIASAIGYVVGYTFALTWNRFHR